MIGRDLDADLALLIGLAGGFVFAVLVAIFTWLANRSLVAASRSLKVAEFRQQWIDGLRDDMSRFLACVMMSGTSSDHEYHYRWHEHRARIQLRLDPTDDRTRRLVRASAEMVEAFLEDNRDETERAAKRFEFTSIGQQILKSEWERLKSDVKSGKI